MIVLHVDDLLIFKSRNQINEVKMKPFELFEMKDLSRASFILGIQIKRDSKKMQLH